MRKLYRFVALSDHWAARVIRSLYRGLSQFSVPAPRLITAPVLAVLIVLRNVAGFLRRVFVAEPLFKAFCTRYGKNLHTGIHTPWVVGKGDLVIGDNVIVDGKCTFFFAARYSERPLLSIGDNTGIGHHCY